MRCIEMSMYSKEVKELCEAFGDKTVKELATGTSGMALAQAVAANVLLNLNSFRDYRELAAVSQVPKGVGKTVNAQLMTAVAYSSWTEGSALAAADPTVATVAITLAPFGKVTLLTDLLANTSALGFVDLIGKSHGGSVRMGFVDKITDAMAGKSSPNSVSLGVKGDSTEASISMANIASGIKENLNDGFIPDFIATSPEKLWTAITTSYAVTQFTGGMADFIVNGKAPQIMGCETYADPYYETAVGAFSGADAEVYGIVGTKGMSAAWAQLQPEPVVDIERLPAGLSNYVITHLDGGAIGGHANSICLLKHAE